MTDAMRRERVVVLTRAPGSALSKTRLAREIGRAKATEVAFALLARTLSNAIGTGYRVLCAFSGPASEMGETLDDVEYRRTARSEDSSMVNLSNAIALMRAEGVGRVLILTSDAPTAETDLLCKMVEQFDEDLVLLGSTDGGVVALRLDPAAPVDFLRVEASSGTVLDQMRRLAERSGLSVAVCGPRTDIDDVASLELAVASGQLRGGDPIVRAAYGEAGAASPDVRV